MKLAVWTNSPSPHLHDFHAALRSAGVEVAVRYFNHLREGRRAMGWSEPESLHSDERILRPDESVEDALADAHERVHLVPGYAYPRARQLVRWLSASGSAWVHWSEASQPSWRAVLTRPLKTWHARQINRHALGAFAQGDLAVRDFLRWGVDHDRIAPLYYSVTPSGPVAPDPELSSWLRGRRAVVFLGALIPRKDPLCLLRAFAVASRGRDDAALVYIGDGPLADRVRREAGRLGIEDRVRVHGFVPMTETPALLACCSTMVLPSRHDGWGMVLNEGAAAGLALIASDGVGAGRHLVSPGENGALFRRGDANALARALAPFVRSPELARRAGEASRARLNDFSPERNVERCLGAIRLWLAGERREMLTGHLNQRVATKAA